MLLLYFIDKEISNLFHVFHIPQPQQYQGFQPEHKRFRLPVPQPFQPLPLKNMGGDHIRLVRPQHIWKLMNSGGVMAPLFLVIESAHVPSDTGHFFSGQLHPRGQHQNRFIPMPGVKVLFAVRVRPPTGGAFVCFQLAQVMEQAHNHRGTGAAPLQAIPGGQGQQGFKAD